MNLNDEKFESAEDLKAWLIDRDVDSEKAAAACGWLFAQGYDQPSTLIGVEFQDFDHKQVPKPFARHISNKLKEQKHVGKRRRCSRNLAYILFCSELRIF